MYVFMYVCMYVCMHACMHACMYACMHVCMYACSPFDLVACSLNAKCLMFHAVTHAGKSALLLASEQGSTLLSKVHA